MVVIKWYELKPMENDWEFTLMDIFPMTVATSC